MSRSLRRSALLCMNDADGRTGGAGRAAAGSVLPGPDGPQRMKRILKRQTWRLNRRAAWRRGPGGPRSRRGWMPSKIRSRPQVETTGSGTRRREATRPNACCSAFHQRTASRSTLVAARPQHGLSHGLCYKVTSQARIFRQGGQWPSPTWPSPTCNVIFSLGSNNHKRKQVRTEAHVTVVIPIPHPDPFPTSPTCLVSYLVSPRQK